MLFSAQHIPYKETGYFSRIVLDYLDEAVSLQPFYNNAPTLEGLKKTIQQKQHQAVDRETLVAELKQQYNTISITTAVQNNIDALLSQNTFTICTAHQPNIFTGPLFFVYKILHVIKLADYLKEEVKEYHFVPVYYMGSEDADFEELNHTYIQGQKIEWERQASGAVGRLTVDKNLLKLIDVMQGQLGVEPFGGDIIALLRSCYTEGKQVQAATFELVNALFSQYGLIVLIPDNAALKKKMEVVFKEDLFSRLSSAVVQPTLKKLEEQYHVQANPRDINLFYLKDTIRERIVEINGSFAVHNTPIKFTKEEVEEELQNHPERFSPNVILRGLYQETILPNIAFIGGGGELAYWLQLKALFEQYKVVYPVLVLRNSFLVIEKKRQELMQQLHLAAPQIFGKELHIINGLIEQEGKKPQLNGEVANLEALYDIVAGKAAATDVTLTQHVAALKAKAVNHIMELEKKMWQAERKKRGALQRQVTKLKQQLFPLNSLQERVENMSTYYAKWGDNFLTEIYTHSLPLEQEFVVLEEA